MRFLFCICLLSAALVVSADAKPAAPSQVEPRPWLGVGFPAASGMVVRIDEIVPDSPADLAGLQVGDVIRGVGNVVIRDGDHLIQLIKGFSVGDELQLDIRRQGRSLRAKVELTAHLDAVELLQRRLVDKEAPSINLDVLSGKGPGQLGKLRGKVVVVTFWTTRCGVCRESFEPLENLQLDHLGELVVLAITGDGKSTVSQSLQKDPTTLTVLHDPRFEVHNRYRYERKIPTAVVIGRDGFVRHADTGPTLSTDDIVLAAKRALRERPSI